MSSSFFALLMGYLQRWSCSIVTPLSMHMILGSSYGSLISCPQCATERCPVALAKKLLDKLAVPSVTTLGSRKQTRLGVIFVACSAPDPRPLPSPDHGCVDRHRVRGAGGRVQMPRRTRYAWRHELLIFPVTCPSPAAPEARERGGRVHGARPCEG